MYSQTSNLKPQIKQGLYCFDRQQINFITYSVEKGFVCDSLVHEQEEQIKLLKDSSSEKDTLIQIKDSLINTLSSKISLKDSIINTKSNVITIQKDEIKHEKKKVLKYKGSTALTILVFFTTLLIL